jgi:hypothetical protein
MRNRRLLLATGTAALLVVSMATAWGGDPPGNNGTVKVGATGSLDDGNGSHVACEFDVTFAGFDEGPLFADATFDLLPPSGRGTIDGFTTPIGEDAAGGANDIDATVGVDLEPEIAASGAEQAAQGFHVKLTIHADGSIGSDVKHKTLWVSGCGGGEGPGEGGEG